MTTCPGRTHRSRYLGLALALLLMEVLVATRLAHLRIIRGSFGDFLFVMLVHCLVQAFRPIRPSRLAMVVLGFSSLVEVAQAFHLASRLGLMPGDLGYLLLGNTFTLLDIGMYAAGCTAALMLDLRLIHPPVSAPPGRHEPNPRAVSRTVPDPVRTGHVDGPRDSNAPGNPHRGSACSRGNVRQGRIAPSG